MYSFDKNVQSQKITNNIDRTYAARCYYYLLFIITEPILLSKFKKNEKMDTADKNTKQVGNSQQLTYIMYGVVFTVDSHLRQ